MLGLCESRVTWWWGTPGAAPAATLPRHPGFWGETGGREATAVRAAGSGSAVRPEPFMQGQEANYFFFLGIPGSSLEGAGEKTRLPWRLPGWGGGWKLSKGAVGFLGLETCFLATAGRIH